MNTSDIKNKSVGEIVKEDFSTVQIFKKYGIDFCCHGSEKLGTACEEQQVDVDKVIGELQKPAVQSEGAVKIPFGSWPLDLLIDYVLKIHHRGIRQNGPELMELLDKVKEVHGDNHPELFELSDLVFESFHDLEKHLQKEENVLFPYLYDLYKASEAKQPAGQMHCGTIQNPIRVMMMEHEAEGERYKHIRVLTNNFTTPEDGCASYHLLMQKLEQFVDALFEHIHIENNIIFPGFIKLEEEWVEK